MRINDRTTQERLNAAGVEAYNTAVEKLLVRTEAVLFFAQCPYDKILGASNLPMLRYEWVWYKSRCTGFLNARRAPLKKTENILVFYQKLPLYNPQFEQGKPYKKIASERDQSPNYGKFVRSGSGSEDGRRFPGNLLSFQTVTHTVHPTQKPVELCEYLIKTYTAHGGFGGPGQRSFFVGHVPPDPGDPAAYQGMGLSV